MIFVRDLKVKVAGDSGNDDRILDWSKVLVDGKMNGIPMEAVQSLHLSCDVGGICWLELSLIETKDGKAVVKYNGDIVRRTIKYPVRRLEIETVGGYTLDSDIWTRDVPASAGHYWFRRVGSDASTARLIKVWHYPGDASRLFTSEDGGASVADPELYGDGEWNGPVPLPVPA